VLFNAGMAVPKNVESCIERRYFSTVHYLALTCTDEALAERLRRRPAWRESGSPLFIEAPVQFNRWFRKEARTLTPPVELLDTTTATVAETAVQVAAWIRHRLDSSVQKRQLRNRWRRSR
jgi:hypothetical protein